MLLGGNNWSSHGDPSSSTTTKTPQEVTPRYGTHPSQITSRLAAAIAALVLALTASALALIPGMSTVALGVCLLVATSGAGCFQLHATLVIARDPAPQDRARVGKVVLGFLPIAAFLIASALLFVDPATGLVAGAVGSLVAIATALVVSWVALVEVLR